MAIIGILQYPDPRLRRIGEQLSPEQIKSAEIQKVVDDMFETLYASDNCAALAATQLDLAESYSITVLDLNNGSEGAPQPLCLINPRIVSASGVQCEREACMSVMPDFNVYANVERADHVVVEALDRHGNPIKLEASGYEAKAYQHEIDHLNGIVYLDRLSELKRQMLVKKIQKAHKVLENRAEK
ncbi:MAG: peptide deformylase [Pseudomonadota bacterium]